MYLTNSNNLLKFDTWSDLIFYPINFDSRSSKVQSNLISSHVTNTSHLVDFCVTQLSTKSQNVKRITGVTGREALQVF